MVSRVDSCRLRELPSWAPVSLSPSQLTDQSCRGRASPRAGRGLTVPCSHPAEGAAPPPEPAPGPGCLQGASEEGQGGRSQGLGRCPPPASLVGAAEGMGELGVSMSLLPVLAGAGLRGCSSQVLLPPQGSPDGPRADDYGLSGPAVPHLGTGCTSRPPQTASWSFSHALPAGCSALCPWLCVPGSAWAWLPY